MEQTVTDSYAASHERRSIDGAASIHKVLVTVIVTHYNYSDFVRTAIESVLRQTHRNLECIVVDDRSADTHRKALRKIVADITDDRLRLVEMDNNRGQITAAFTGLKHASGEFVCMLDPDDIYEPNCLERLLKCHLNTVVYAPMAFCDMGLCRTGGQILSHTYTGFRHRALNSRTYPRVEAQLLDFGFSAFYPPEQRGWLWATTSSMMFRRDALQTMVRDDYNANLKFYLDAYCAFGCHMMGGTLYIDEVLCWRGLHDRNTAESESVISMFQNRQRPEFQHLTKEMRDFAVDTLILNHAEQKVGKRRFRDILLAQFDGRELAALRRKFPHVTDLLVADLGPYD